MKTISAPEKIDKEDGYKIFLAGSIEQNKASFWQKKVIEALKDYEGTILNPRREEWDENWEQDINNRVFNEQVNWELNALESSDLIIMYFDINTKSPITLLELGLFAKSKKLIVCCGDGFWRKGNVDIVCKRYKIKQVSTLKELINEAKKQIK